MQMKMKIFNFLYVCLASLMLLTEMWMCCYCFLTLPTTWPSKLLIDLKLLIVRVHFLEFMTKKKLRICFVTYFKNSIELYITYITFSSSI